MGKTVLGPATRGVDEVIQLKGMRKAIADNVARSLRSSAQITSFFEVDATQIEVVRQDLAREIGQGRLGYNALIVAALGETLRAHPLFNASITETAVTVYGDVNVGVAVALDETFGLGGGLIVPVVHDADKKSVADIELELADKVERARAGALKGDDVARGTFTLTNLGSLQGAEYWRGVTPVIHGSQAAILGIGRVRPSVVVGEDGAPVVRPILPLSLTHDHRLLDGAAAGAFVVTFVEVLRSRDSFSGGAHLGRVAAERAAT